MKHIKILILFVFLLHAVLCFADDETFAERVSPLGIFIKTPEYIIEIFEPDTVKSHLWTPGDKLIVTPRGYLINVDRRESVHMVDVRVRNSLYDSVDDEVMDEN